MTNKNQDEKNCPVCGGCIPCGRCTCSKDDIIATKDKEKELLAKIEKLNKEKDRMWKQNELTDFYISKRKVRNAIIHLRDAYPEGIWVCNMLLKSLNLSQQEEK